MACCDWDTFESAFLHSWRLDKLNPSPLLIDWKRAKIHWKKYHCTGAEAAFIQLRDLKKESEFAIVEQLTKSRSEDVEDSMGMAATRAAPIAARLIADELLNRIISRKDQ